MLMFKLRTQIRITRTINRCGGQEMKKASEQKDK